MKIHPLAEQAMRLAELFKRQDSENLSPEELRKMDAITLDLYCFSLVMNYELFDEEGRAHFFESVFEGLKKMVLERAKQLEENLRMAGKETMPIRQPEMSFEEFTILFKIHVQELSEVSERFLNFIEPVKIKPIELARERLGNFIRDLNELLREVNEHSSSQLS